MKRLWPLLLLGLALASEGERYLYVRWDAGQNRAFLSDGPPLPPDLAMLPRQYVELEQGRIKPKRQWQPTQDLVKVYLPWEVGRVVFSHERHFVALGAKGNTCETCHTVLDENKVWKSRTQAPALERHGATSLERFCATCHRGASSLSSQEALKVQACRQAQLALIQNPEDEKAFNVTPPPTSAPTVTGWREKPGASGAKEEDHGRSAAKATSRYGGPFHRSGFPHHFGGAGSDGAHGGYPHSGTPGRRDGSGGHPLGPGLPRGRVWATGLLLLVGGIGL